MSIFKENSPFWVFFLLSVYPFILAAQEISLSVSQYVMLSLIGFFFLILLMEFIVILFLDQFLPVFFVALLLSLALMVNVIGFYFSLYGELLSQTASHKIYLAIGLWLVLFGLLLLVSREGVVAYFCKILSFVVVLVSFSQIIFSGMNSGLTDLNTNSVDLNRFRAIEFKGDKPNIHLISFDAMSPEILVNDNLGAKVSYGDVLSNAGAKIYRNAFSSQAPTLNALSSIASLANPDFSFNKNKAAYFSGTLDSPLFAIFKANGYKIATGYDAGKKQFGEKGRYIDNYINSNDWVDLIDDISKNSIEIYILDSSICKFQGEIESQLQYLGFCYWAKTLSQKQMEKIKFEAGNDSPMEATWPEFVIKYISSKGLDSEPWLTMHHIYYPIGHVFSSYNHAEKKSKQRYKKYLENGERMLSRKLLPLLIKEIEKNDPNAMVLVYGDHGMYLSQGFPHNIAKYESASKADFFIKDRYGIFLARFQGEKICQKASDFEYYRDGFITTERLLAATIRCLAKAPNQVDSLMQFREAHSYKEHLYE